MKRFMGMMPVNEIKIEKIYKDDNGFKLIVQAGEHGWTILYDDGGVIYDDIDNTPEDNLKLALKELRTHIHSFKEDVMKDGEEEDDYEEEGEETKMDDAMNFPKTFEEFTKEYQIVDTKEVYTNGVELIPVFRVQQWLDYIEEESMKEMTVEQYRERMIEAFQNTGNDNLIALVCLPNEDSFKALESLLRNFWNKKDGEGDD